MMGKKKEVLVAENASLSREVELLREHLDDRRTELETTRTQLRYTQEALIAKESPEAYRDQKYAEEQAAAPELTPEQTDELAGQKQKAEVERQYLQELESPLFKNADDMIQLLSRSLVKPISETTSVHANDES